MGLQENASIVLDRRAHAQAGDPGERLIREPKHFHDIDPRSGSAARRHAHVQGGIGQRASKLAAVNHMAAHDIATSQKVRRTGHVTERERGTHLRAGDPLAALIRDVFECVYRDPILTPQTPEHLDIAHPSMAKSKILAHQQPPGVERGHKQVFDEILSRHGRHRFVKARNRDAAHALIAKRRHLVAQATDLRGRHFRASGQFCKVLTRVRGKGHDRRREVQLVGRRIHAREHGLVTTMHAVKVPNGEGTGGMIDLIRQIALDSKQVLHGRQFTIYACFVFGSPCQIPLTGSRMQAAPPLVSIPSGPMAPPALLQANPKDNPTPQPSHSKNKLTIGLRGLSS